MIARAGGLVAVGCGVAPPGPRTALGRALALALVVLTGALVVGPVGIVVTEWRRATRSPRAARACARCAAGARDADAAYCRHCGARLAARGPVPDAGHDTA